METYLSLFEQAIRKQADLVGEKLALQQARKAGLGVSKDGHIVSCTGHPQLVLMRLIRCFTADGNIQALAECTPLLNELITKMEESGTTETGSPPSGKPAAVAK